jgi:molybdate transport system ATP-binding protein
VSWVIQGDGLHTLAQEFVALPSDSHRIRLPAQVVQVRHLGETTLALLAPHDLQQVEVRLVRSGPERQRIQAGQTLWLELDCDWVHVMPTRQA